MTNAAKSAMLRFDNKEIELPIYSPTVGPDVLEFVSFTQKVTSSPMIQGSPLPLLVKAPLHLLMATRASCCTAAIRLTNWRWTLTI